jgi:hypothetical protein
MTPRERAIAYIKDAEAKLSDALDFLERAQATQPEQREEDRHQLRTKGELWDTFVKEKRKQRSDEVAVGKGAAANPADEGTPPGYEEVGVLCLNFVHLKLPEDLLQLPGGFKLGKFKFRLRGYRWVREYPLYQLADNRKEGEQGHGS